MIAMMAFPIGLRWRGADHAVRAVYLFHRSGDPLATVASDFVPPIAADELGPVLGAVRTFVDTPTAAREFHLTSQRFGDEGLVAVHGRFVSACAVYRGARSEEHTSELQSPYDLVCRLLLEKKNQ